MMKFVEQIQVKKNKELSRICHVSKNLYNEANHVIRQKLFKDDYWTRYYELNISFKDSESYKTLPIQTSQQVLRVLDRNWKSFFNTVKSWKKYPEKYKGRPRLPRYKKKNGEFLVIFTNQQCRIKNGFLVFPKRAGLQPIKTRIISKIRQVRILPRGEWYVIEIVYEKEGIDLGLDKDRILGIDLGLNNLITAVNNVGLQPILIKGGMIKSINQYYNKRVTLYRSIRDTQKYRFETKRLRKLTLNRNNKIKDVFHKVSKKVINYCIENNIGKIVIGYTDNWKQGIRIGRINNQKFVQVPFLKLVKMLQYKAELVGIDAVLVEEGYTSTCSFMDEESLVFHEIYVGKRINRGLFKTRDGQLINADVNGACNILKKAVPKAFIHLKINGIEDVVRHPRSLCIEG